MYNQVFLLSEIRIDVIRFKQQKVQSLDDIDIVNMFISFHEADNPQTRARFALFSRSLVLSLSLFLIYSIFIYITRVYILLRARTHIFGRGIYRASTSIYRRIGDWDLAGPPRLDSTCDYSIHRPVKSTSARCVPWSFSLSLSLFLCLSPALFRSFLSRFLYALSLFFPLSRVQTLFCPLLDITVFCLSFSRTVPLSRFSISVRRSATLRSRPLAPFGVEND